MTAGETWHRLPRLVRRGLALFGAAAVLATGTTMVRNSQVQDHQLGRISTSCPVLDGQAVQAPVTKVTDGDTIHTLVCGKDRTDRIIGLNTPETVKSGTAVQCYGKQASDNAKAKLAGRTVTLTPDKKAGYKDKYGRYLYYVDYSDESGDHDYGADAIRSGYGEHNDYGHKHARTDTYALAEAQAIRERMGAWGACPDPFKV